MRVSLEEFSGGQPVVNKNGATPAPVKENKPSFAEAAKQVGIGAAKGLGDTVMGLGNTLTEGGRFVQAAIDPTRTVQDFRDQASANGGTPFAGQMERNINEALKSDNNYQKAGKAGEFVAELLFPVGLLAKGSKLPGAMIDGIGSRIAAIGDDVVEGGVKVKDKMIDLVTNLDDKTKTALQRTPREIFDKFYEQGKQAMLDDRNRTPLEAVGDSVAEGLRMVKEKASQIGAKKSEMIKLPEAFKGDGITRFNEKLQSFKNSRNLIENDKTVVKQIIEEFKNLGTNPTKGQVDRFIDFAQDALYAGERNLTLPTSNKTTGGLKKLIGELNEDLKSQLPDQYRTLNEEYSRLSGLMSELNTKLGKEAGNAGALVKRLFSPSDARTKELFDQLEKETGQDFFRDARIAKFVMKALDDTRADSLLEQIPKSPTGIIEKGFDWAKDKLTDPIESAKRFIDKNMKSSEAKDPKNFAGVIGGVEQDAEGNINVDPVNAALSAFGAGTLNVGTKNALKELIQSKEDGLYLLKQRRTQLGEKGTDRLISTLEKELKALKDRFKRG